MTRPVNETPILEVEGLSIGPPESSHDACVVDGIDLAIGAGEVLALVGESGSGKSMTALSIVRLLPKIFDIRGGSIRFAGADVRAMSGADIDRLRGGRVGMIFQQPQAMLDPTATVGSQVAEALRLHRGLDRKSAGLRAVELMREVGIPEPAERARSYAHQMSGGMAQRVMIAAALSADPDLLIADEPTTALDVTVQAQILALLDRERRNRRLAILLITHDLTIVASMADRVAVMYAGRIVEDGPAATVLRSPRHPYTQALLRCSLLDAGPGRELFSIPPAVDGRGGNRRGCRFRPRCTAADEHGVAAACESEEPHLALCGQGCRARCWAVATADGSRPP